MFMPNTYLMRSQWLFSAALVGLMVALGPAQHGTTLSSFYNGHAATCILAVAVLLLGGLMGTIYVGKRDSRKLITSKDCIFGLTAVSAAIAVEGAFVWDSDLAWPSALLFAFALLAAAGAAILTTLVRDRRVMFWESPSYWMLVGYHALSPAAIAFTVSLFAEGTRVDPFWMTPVNDLWKLGIAGALLFIQFAWSTELDHAATRRQSGLRIVEGSRAAA
jgi:hypothetical protein